MITLKNPRWWLLFWGAFLAALAGAAILPGCSAQHWGGDTAGKRPSTTLERTAWGGLKIEWTTDGSGELKNLCVRKTKSDTEIRIESLTMNQQAAPVVIAEAEKLKSIEDLQRVQVEYMAQISKQIASLSEAATGILAPWSTAVIKVAEAYMAARPVTTQPATQPAEP